MIAWANGLLKEYKSNLGPFYDPALYLVGALIFITLLGGVVGAPIVFLGSHLLAVVLQAFLLIVYLFLLQAVRYNVVDRFAFSLCFAVVMLSAATTIDADFQYRDLAATSDALRAIAVPHVTLAVFGVLRGLGFFAWAVPLVVVYLTFASAADIAKSDRLWVRSLWAGITMQVVALVVVLFFDGAFSRATAQVPDAAPDWLSTRIEYYQVRYAVSYVAALTLGLITLAVIGAFKIKQELRLLVAVTAGVVAVSLVFLLSQIYSEELNKRYPDARQNETVLAFDDPATGRITYVHPFLRRLGGDMAQFESVFACRDPDSGVFRYEARQSGELGREQSSDRLRVEEPAMSLCVPDE